MPDQWLGGVVRWPRACSQKGMRSFLLFLAVVLSAAAAACGEADIDYYEPAPAVPTPPDDFTFRTGVIPVLDGMLCAEQCHNATSLQSNFDIEAGGDEAIIYDNLMVGGGQQEGGAGLVVNVPDPPASLILTAPMSGEYTSHPVKVYTDYEDPRYVTILGWIQSGALEN